MSVVVAVLTPSGRGAVATIALRGAEAGQQIARFFQPAGKFDALQLPLYRVVFGQWQREKSGEELVICRTSNNELEIHCHGGNAAVEAIVGDLIATGARRVASEEYLQNGSLDAIQQAALLALADARTERTAAILLDQYRGALSREVEANNTLALTNFQEAQTRRADLLALADIGLHLTRPWRVVLAGPPNVGKSSLINALLGYNRAIVFDQPGTTRDVLSAITALDGWPIELSDTAGVRQTDDLLEAAGVEHSQREQAAADLVVWVSDARELDAVPPEQKFANALFVANKCDLLTPDAPRSDRHLYVSARTGIGLAELQQAMVTRLVPDPPPSGAAVPFTREQVDQLHELF